MLDPALCIVAVSNAYAEATMVRREDIIGRSIFEVFPDNPDDPAADGVKQLRASLQQVLQHRTTSVMALQKYDIRNQNGEDNGFEVRYWSPRNSPVLDQNGSLRAC